VLTLSFPSAARSPQAPALRLHPPEVPQHLQRRGMWVRAGQGAPGAIMSTSEEPCTEWTRPGPPRTPACSEASGELLRK